jgi:hypothetical protein
MIAGVNATLLKAYFDEDFVIPNPVVPDPNDPTKVIPYTGEPLTVGGELNKLITPLVGVMVVFTGVQMVLLVWL